MNIKIFLKAFLLYNLVNF